MKIPYELDPACLPMLEAEISWQNEVWFDGKRRIGDIQVRVTINNVNLDVTNLLDESTMDDVRQQIMDHLNDK